MRRILRKIAANEYQDLGDTSTLADPSVVNDLIDNRQNNKLVKTVNFNLQNLKVL